MDSAIDDWLQQFVHDHGLNKVVQVLGPYLLDAKDCTKGSCGVERNFSGVLVPTNASTRNHISRVSPQDPR